MTKETINTSTRDTKFSANDQGKNPLQGKPFVILFLLGCHKMFKKEYNHPIQKTSSKIKPTIFRYMFPTSIEIIGNFSCLRSTKVKCQISTLEPNRIEEEVYVWLRASNCMNVLAFLWLWLKISCVKPSVGNQKT